MPALALIFHLCDLVVGDFDRGEAIGERPIKLAILWTDFFWRHAEKIYNTARLFTDGSAQMLVQKLIAAEEQGGNFQPITNGFTWREITQRHWAGFSSDTPEERTALQKVFDKLLVMNWLKEYETATGGRPTKVYFLNPKVLSFYAADKEEVAA